ncbi:MAG: EamA family transporter [Clostridiales bacterium]|nr:EamA family transporter [Clostridiales bacterium]
MWIVYAVASAFFAGITAILIKIGIKKLDSNLATALRTLIVLAFSWGLVLLANTHTQIASIPQKSIIFLMLSGVSTSIAWLCYFKALQLGDVSRVAPVDKSSTIITILLSFLVLKEKPTKAMIIGIFLLAAGVLQMIRPTKHDKKQSESKSWLFYAMLSAVFIALTAIFGKIGVGDVEPSLATAIRTVIVAIMVWIIVFVQNKQKLIKTLSRRNWLFILLSGISTGLAWILFFQALKGGRASIVVPIEKLNIIVTVVFSHFLLKEKLSKNLVIGLCLLVVGTLLMLF